MTKQYLSMKQIAEMADLSYATVRTYRTRDVLPEPDIVIGEGHGSAPGWSEEKIRRWVATLPGREEQQPIDPIEIAQTVVDRAYSEVRYIAEQHVVRAETARWKWVDRRAAELASEYFVTAQRMHECRLWVELAKELEIYPDEPETPTVRTADEARHIIEIAARHAGYAYARIELRREMHRGWLSTDHYRTHKRVLELMEHHADVCLISSLDSYGVRVDRWVDGDDT